MISQPVYENASMDGVVEEHTPYVLIEGVLEKSKLRKDTFLKFTRRRSKAKWTRRYFVLRCGEVPDAFFLDQYSDASRSSKIRKTIDMERVSQVDTNVLSKDGNKNWIFSIHFSARSEHSPKNSVLYLAANSEEQMNRWVAHLCYACNLEKQEDNEPYGTSPNITVQQQVGESNSTESRTHMNGGDFFDRSFDSFTETPSSDSSVVDKFTDEQSTQKNSGEYTLLKDCGSAPKPSSCEVRRESNPDAGATTHPYIHLKNCTSTRTEDAPKDYEKLSSGHRRNHSTGSSSVSSSRASSSAADSDSAANDLPSRSVLHSLVPPPRPPKGTHVNIRKNGIREELYEIYSNGIFHLDQTLPPPHLDEIGIDEDRGWSGETIKPAEETPEPCEPQAGPSWEAPLPFSMSKSSVSKVEQIAPLPPDGELIPPKVDRSCKPRRRGVSADETNAPSSIGRINSFVKRYDKHSYSGPCPPIMPPRKTTEDNSIHSASPKPKLSVPIIPRTNPLNRVQREPKPPAALPPPQASGMLEYFDPIEGVTVMRSASAVSVAGETAGPAKVDVPNRAAHSVEYVLIDEQSTKAVFEANMQQNELRSMGKPLG